MRPALLVAACLAGCQSPMLPLPQTTAGLTLTTTATDCGGQGVLGQTTQFRVRTFAGAGLEDEQMVRASDGVPTSVWVSAGEARRVTIEAMDARGAVVAVARSARLTVEPGKTRAVALRLRPIEAFSAVCGAPVRARVGHAAAVLDDGAVWLAGGVGEATSERFDPDTEQFTATAAIAVGGVALPRAHATATRLANGQVVLWGGEHLGAPSSVTLVYDAQADAFGAVPARVSPPSVPRSRHFAFRLGQDVVALGGAPAQVERLPVATFKPTVEGTVPAAEAAIARVGEKQVVVSGATTAVVTFGSGGVTSTQAQATAPRSFAAAATLGAGALIAGGDGAEAGSSVWVGADGAVLPGPAIFPRAEACAVALEDGRVLLVGGRAGTTAVDAAELVALDRSAVAVAGLGGARLHATCTLLADGTVLVVGGGGPPVRFTPR